MRVVLVRHWCLVVGRASLYLRVERIGHRVLGKGWGSVM
jgi:hypothetical protein